MGAIFAQGLGSGKLKSRNPERVGYERRLCENYLLITFSSKYELLMINQS
jgi:hypothetical protein